MPVLEEFVHLLTNDLPVVSLVVTAHDLQVLHCHDDVLLLRRPLDELLHGQQVSQRIVIYLLWLAGLLCLVLHSHQHKVEELLHTVSVQLHDRAVG